MCIGIPKHWRLSLIQVQNYYWLLEFSLLTREERDNFYYADYSIWPINARHIPLTQLDWSRQGPKINSLRPTSNLNSLLFFKITKNPSPSLSGMTSFEPQSHFHSGVFITTSVIVTSSVHEREDLRSMCAPTRALTWIVQSLTKPNKI